MICGNLGGVLSRLARMVLPAATAAAAAAAGEPSAEEEPGVSAPTASVAASAGACIIEPMRANREESDSATEEADFIRLTDTTPSALTGYNPSAVSRQMVLDGCGREGSLPGTTAAALRFEVKMLEMLVRRTHAQGFAQWCVRSHSDVEAIRMAAESVRNKLLALLGQCPATLVRTV